MENELIPSSYLRDTIKLEFLKKCAYYKPIQLREVDNEAEYQRLKNDDFCRFALCYGRKDNQYLFHKMDSVAQIRFVELLASLTLYHFSKASREVYYQCLDLRGLEFCSTEVHGTFEKIRITPVDLNGFEGKRTGQPTDPRFNEFSIYYGYFNMGLREKCKRLEKVVSSFYYDRPTIFPVLRKFKMLSMGFDQSLHHDFLPQVCSELITLDVENVQLFISFNSPYENRNPKAVTASNLAQLLDFCTHVKTLSICSFKCYESPFAEVKSVIENWSHKAHRLDIFKFMYSNRTFQLHDHKLLRCVRVGNEYFWTAEYDIDGSRFGTNSNRLTCGTSFDYIYKQHIYSHDFERHLKTVLPFYEQRKKDQEARATNSLC